MADVLLGVLSVCCFIVGAGVAFGYFLVAMGAHDYRKMKLTGGGLMVSAAGIAVMGGSLHFSSGVFQPLHFLWLIAMIAYVLAIALAGVGLLAYFSEVSETQGQPSPLQSSVK